MKNSRDVDVKTAMVFAVLVLLQLRGCHFWRFFSSFSLITRFGSLGSIWKPQKSILREILHRNTCSEIFLSSVELENR